MMLREEDGLGPSLLRTPWSSWRGGVASRESGLSRLRAVVLLGGNVNPTSFRTAIRRSLLDLPVERRLCLSQLWRRQVDSLRATLLPGTALTMRFVYDRKSPRPTVFFGRGLRVRFERDPTDWRGTGGLVRDLASEYQPDDRILVAGAAQVLTRPLSELVEMLASSDADVSVMAHEDGSPVTLMLVRCACLRGIPSIGFADLKEQALPTIALSHHVAVVRQRERVAMPLRTFSDYIAALKRHHSPASLDCSPFQERWSPSFSLVESGAEVSASSHTYDSVVLRGGRVDSGAVVVRSLVCPGARVRRRSIIVDRLVTPE